MSSLNRRKQLDQQLAAIHGSLSPRGRRFWRSLEELAETEAFQELMRQEFPQQADVWPDDLSRRRFLSLMGASLALAGLSGCSVKPAPPANIIPYVRRPETFTPGKPLFFATAAAIAGEAVGLLVESHAGRPTKVEGNPDHPASLGATSALCQASVLTLYDPDRAQAVTYDGEARQWEDAVAALKESLAQARSRRGAGWALLTEPVLSPTLGQWIARLLREAPAARWHQYEPIHNDAAQAGSQAAFGSYVNPVYDFSHADIVVSLGNDFLTSGPGHLRHARQFTERRRVRTGVGGASDAMMNRLYVVETSVSPTGAKADHRLALKPDEIEWFARALAAEIQAGPSSPQPDPRQRWIAAIGRDLTDHRGRCLVLAGRDQPAAVHLLAHAMNQHLGNVGRTVRYTQPAEFQPAPNVSSLRELVEDMKSGRVDTLLILGGNPAYTAPADLEFGRWLRQVRLTVHHSLYRDETSRLCHWHIPESHYLESWGDLRALDGTASLVQPLITPLYASHSGCEVLAASLTGWTPPTRELVRSYWRDWHAVRHHDGDFEAFWETSLHDGVVAGTPFPSENVTLRDDWQQRLAALGHLGSPSSDHGPADFQLCFQPDPCIHDGRFANNGWLQELPRPITKLTWDNAALVSPSTAKQLGVQRGSFAHGGEHGGYDMPVVSLKIGERAVTAPVWIVPGQADGVVTVQLGFGRTAAGRVGGTSGATVGFNAYVLRDADHPWTVSSVEIALTEQLYPLASTQSHFVMEGRDVARQGTLSQYQSAPQSVAASDAEPHQPRRDAALATLYPPPATESSRKRWSMTIDLTACVGCNACITACQAENNIPVVGKEQVRFGREMHWLRVDRYVSGPPEAPGAFLFQPVPCMQCEMAPCEYVCPVAATVHSADGLNDMVYNRCVGTRFCSNNCPYKVRRFNFLQFADFQSMPQRLQLNPDVTVRSRGVMEKCTYCVQRIRHAEADALAAGRPLRDGEVLSACQAACPAEAIIFGDANDPHSRVSREKESPLQYSLLEELGTRPRTTYLAALRNPNPALDD